MIEINFLPLSLREKRGRGIRLPPIAFLLVGGGVLLLFLLSGVVLTNFTQERAAQLQKLEEELQRLKPESDKVAYLKMEKQKLERRMVVIEQLLNRRLLWANKLNELSNLIPSQIWLTSIFIEEKIFKTDSSEKAEDEEIKKVRFLIIKGIAVSGEEAGGLQLVGDFMEKIRNNHSFFANFLNIEQRNFIRRGKINGLESKFFELSCQFREGR